MLESFTCETFGAYLHDRFTVHVDDGNVHTMELVEATESPTNPGFDGARVPFSVVFLDPSAEVLPQRIYGVEHGELGTFDLFIVPISAGSDGVRYEAVFS